ncbi:hypothetical protein NQ038_03920 [Brevibacterium sp. 50QC2O2]|uniref:hypothetical protein n=1 Tax=Brevibacterium TaxID=1696 RepID=UPI00211C0936|nr:MULTISPECIES: hypothetical protein [unclassified Brevibacterium]MCQ9369552.1 hypothetical protein [Brevibacterium sp. 91QC2O2]MCQ9385166.1 hypothetical protein [Brevibacterium sp. 68QC2CO]MCQ9387789.1 hypothetical protein [Brevibacterium sp. 50QC2O2]
MTSHDRLYSALLVVADTTTPPQVMSVAGDVLAGHDFTVRRAAAPVSELAGLCTGNAGGVDVVVVVARLSPGRGNDASARIRRVLEHPLPGLSELVRSIQYASGYGRAMFEDCAAGWIGTTLVLVLPADTGAIFDSLHEVLPLLIEVSYGVQPTDSDFFLPDSPGLAEDPIPLRGAQREAKILHLPTRPRPDSSRAPGAGPDDDPDTPLGSA